MVRRSVCPYYGGKWRIASWVVKHLPPHRCYVEPFGGVASVLLKKPQSLVEVYNDVNEELVNLFQVLRDEDMCKELLYRLTLTPFARAEFVHCWKTYRKQPIEDKIDAAWGFLVYANMSVGSSACSDRNGTPGWENRIFDSRADPTKVTNAARAWDRLPEALAAIARRFKNVAIDNRDAFQLLNIYDREGAGVLFYLDPPYINTLGYQDTPFTQEHHEALLRRAVTLKTACAISGYESDLYNDYLSGWICFRRNNLDFRSQIKRECLWVKGCE